MQWLLAGKRSRGSQDKDRRKKSEGIRLERWQQQAGWRRTCVNFARTFGQRRPGEDALRGKNEEELKQVSLYRINGCSPLYCSTCTRLVHVILSDTFLYESHVISRGTLQRALDEADSRHVTPAGNYTAHMQRWTTLPNADGGQS